MVLDKFNAKEIEVAQTSFSLPVMETRKTKKNGILCVLTFYSQQKLSIHQ